MVSYHAACFLTTSFKMAGVAQEVSITIRHVCEDKNNKATVSPSYTAHCPDIKVKSESDESVLLYYYTLYNFIRSVF